jgi:hypothetical protein
LAAFTPIVMLIYFISLKLDQKRKIKEMDDF